MNDVDDRWLREALGRILPRPPSGDVLLGLVNLVKRENAFLNACGVEWVGNLKNNVSFRTARGDVRLISAEAPDAPGISRTLLAECVEAGAPRWVGVGEEQVDLSRSLAGVVSAGCIPVGGRAALYVATSVPGILSPELRARIERIAGLCGALLDAPGGAVRAVETLPGLVGDSEKMQDIARTVRAFASVPWPVLILGETGTGKEAVARALHQLSGRSGRFTAVNCAAIAEGLAESELFGHVRGGFTNAVADHDGYAKETASGTLFLDEVGELPGPIQAKLLRLLQEHSFRPVGGKTDLRFEGRIVAATHRAVEDPRNGAFRRDLFQRLSACVVRLPPLRERREDIPALARSLLARALAEVGGEEVVLAEDALGVLRSLDWPGNVRELDNVVKRGLIGARMRGDRVIRPRDVLVQENEAPLPVGDALEPAIEGFRRKHVGEVLEAAGGNKSKAATRLGISRQALHEMLRRWNAE